MVVYVYNYTDIDLFSSTQNHMPEKKPYAHTFDEESGTPWKVTRTGECDVMRRMYSTTYTHVDEWNTVNRHTKWVGEEDGIEWTEKIAERA